MQNLTTEFILFLLAFIELTFFCVGKSNVKMHVDQKLQIKKFRFVLIFQIHHFVNNIQQNPFRSGEFILIFISIYCIILMFKKLTFHYIVCGL